MIPYPDALRQTISERIRAERIRLGITYTDMGRILDVQRNSYRAIEEAGNPKLSTLFNLIEKAGMDPKRIVPEWFK